MTCEGCANELNGTCYCDRTVYQQIQQTGGHRIARMQKDYCPRYRQATPEEKERIRRQAEWWQKGEAAEWDVDEMIGVEEEKECP